MNVVQEEGGPQKGTAALNLEVGPHTRQPKFNSPRAWKPRTCSLLLSQTRAGDQETRVPVLEQMSTSQTLANPFPLENFSFFICENKIKIPHRAIVRLQ